MNYNAPVGYISIARSGETDYFIMEKDKHVSDMAWIYWKADWDIDLIHGIFGVKIDSNQKYISIAKYCLRHEELGNDPIITTNMKYLTNNLDILKKDHIFRKGINMLFGGKYRVKTECLDMHRIVNIDLLIKWRQRCYDSIDYMSEFNSESIVELELPHIIERDSRNNIRSIRR